MILFPLIAFLFLILLLIVSSPLLSFTTSSSQLMFCSVLFCFVLSSVLSSYLILLFSSPVLFSINSSLLSLLDYNKEIDSHGVCRSVAQLDEMIDTDLFHHITQRMKVDTILPELEKQLLIIKDKILNINGEYSCVIQYGYEKSVAYVQRHVRGKLARMYVKKILKRFIYSSFLAAVVSVQVWVRALTGQYRYKDEKKLKYELYANYSAKQIQKIIRGWTKRSVYQRTKKKKRENKKYYAIIRFQAIIRGYLGRRKRDAEIFRCILFHIFIFCTVIFFVLLFLFLFLFLFY